MNRTIITVREYNIITKSCINHQGTQFNFLVALVASRLLFSSKKLIKQWDDGIDIKIR